MKNENTPTQGNAGAKKDVQPTQAHNALKASRMQCNDCLYYRWKLHKKRGTCSVCSFTGEYTDPTFDPCEFFREASYE